MVAVKNVYLGGHQTGKKIITDFIKRHKISYIIGILFMLLTSYTQALIPDVLGKTIDLLKTEGFEYKSIWTNITIMMLIGTGAFISAYIWRNLVIGNARNLECHLRDMLYTHLQTLSPNFYSKRKTGDLIAYAINDISAVRMTFGPAMAMTINGIAISIISIYSMSRVVDWKLTIMSLVPIPLIVYFMLKIGRIVQKRFRKVQESFASISDRVQENIYGIRVIKAYVQEEDEVRNFEKLNDRMMETNIEMVRISSFLSPVIELCFSISFVLNLIIGGNMVLNGSISLGDFTAFNGYLALIMSPVISIGRVITIFQRGMASLKRLDEIFNVDAETRDGKRMTKKHIEGEIEFRDLEFSYPETDEKALKNISIRIPKGHTIGIIGKTGCGKTTIASLLLKLYNVESGRLYLDGTDINDYSLEALRECYGYVPQDNFLFSASISDNIKFFKDTYEDEEVIMAAKLSCIYDSIMEFPDGFATLLGERGVNLSGGQKQRISIARALLRNPSVLILDDALSAVDTITEARIIDNLKMSRKGKTNIIISHRVSAVEGADEIIVLDNGCIRERGTHETLLAEGGLYCEIYAEQYKDRGKGCRNQAS